jgi:signal transduction histidine kinase
MSVRAIVRSLDTTAWSCIAFSLIIAVWVFSSAGPDFPKPPQGVFEVTSVTHLRGAERSNGVAAGAKAGDSGNKSVTSEKALGLPLMFPAQDTLQGVESFEIRSPDLDLPSQAGVCITRLSASGEIKFEGQLIGTPSRTDKGVVNNSWGAHFAALPNAKSGRLTVEIIAGTGKPLALWPIWVGPVERVRQACQRLDVKRRLVSGGIGLIMLSFGLMTIAQSYRQKDSAARWFGVTAVLAGAKPLQLGIVDPPMSDELWTMLYYCLRLLYIPVVYVFIASLINSPQKSKLMWTVLSIHAFFALLFIFGPASSWLMILRIQGAVYILIGLLIFWEVLQFQRQKITQIDVIITWFFILSLVLHILDYFLLLIDGEMHYSSISLTAFPTLFMAVVLMLVEKSSVRLVIAEESAKLLALKVQTQVTELDAANLEIARARDDAMLAAERRKIVRDMHDGVGSHLVGAVSYLSKSSENSKAMEMVERALLEMRSAVDATESDGTHLEALLGTFRQRIEPALSEHGIELVWEMGALSERVQALDSEKQLNILRITQEALSNVLRHSKASKVAVQVFSESAMLIVSIADDGQGFNLEETQNGKGLRNFDIRSAQIGAVLKIASTPSGTQVYLEVPLC